MIRLLTLLIALQLTGCASYFKKQSCEAINWFEHGQSVALRGQWLNADATVNECRKVEADIRESDLDRGFKSGVAKYCSNSNVYIIGKNGDFFSRDLCEGPQIQVLLNEHQNGVRDYCAKSNGITAGASGKKYQNICPKDLETDFLKEYRKGRKKYVQTLIDSKSQEIRELDSEIVQKRNELSYARGSLSSLENQKSLLELQKSTAMNSNQVQLVTYFDAQLSSLTSDLNIKRSSVSNLQRDLDTLEAQKAARQKEISEFKAELPGLDH